MEGCKMNEQLMRDEAAADSEILPATVQEIVESGIESVPAAFIRLPHERPDFNAIFSHNSGDRKTIPVIDISGLHSPAERPGILRLLADACANWGFFQVIGHDISMEVVDQMRSSCLRFFALPKNEKAMFRNQDVHAPVSYHTSFNPSQERAREWRDALHVRDLPDRKINGFNCAPTICRDAMKVYKHEVQKLAYALYEAIFESLGLSSKYVNNKLPGIPSSCVTVNYYPKCRDPSLTFGLSAHTDASSMTVLLIDEVPGLQVRKGDQWILVEPITNSFIVNIADIIQLLSNGKYKSIEHRVVTNQDKARMSVSLFVFPADKAIISPISMLVSEKEPPIYKDICYEEYLENVYSKPLLPNKGSIDFAKRNSRYEDDL